MPRFVDPKTFLLGYTTANIEGIKEYLAYTKQEKFLEFFNEAKEQGISDGECLCSFYAKLCYKSLVEGKNANITKVREIPANVISTINQGHGSVFEHCSINFVATDVSRIFCYTPDCEIFTQKGWKNITNLQLSDVLLTMDPKTQKSHWSNIISLHDFDYKGLIGSWQSSQMETPGMTTDHLLWCAPLWATKAKGLTNRENMDRYASKTQLKYAFGQPFAIDHGVRWIDSNNLETVTIGEYKYDAFDLFTWLGWMSTDGGFDKNRESKCQIVQSKFQYLNELEELMNSLFNTRWKHYEYDGLHEFRIHDEKLSQWAKDMIGPSGEYRDLAPELFELETRLLRAFYNAAIKGDGNIHHKNGHEVLYCSSKHAAGQWQVIVARLGMCANVRENKRLSQEHEVKGIIISQTKPSYVVSVSHKSASLVKRHHQKIKNYEGKVYCPKTEDGIVYVRKNGLPFWASNTHELVRMRAGWAYSQTSGRYCRLDTIDIVKRPILDDCQDLVLEAVTACEKAVYLMECRKKLRKPNPSHPDVPAEACYDWSNQRIHEYLSGLTLYNVNTARKFMKWIPDDNLKDFDYKKAVTSAIRSIAPNGQANEIGFSINFRAIRHFLMLRSNRGAEWEIRKVTEQVFELIKDKFPLLLHGHKTKKYDGIVEITGMRTQPYELTLDDPKALQYFDVSQMETEILRRKIEKAN